MFLTTALLVAGALVILISVLNAGLYTSTSAAINQNTDQQQALSTVNGVAGDIERTYNNVAADADTEAGLTEYEQQQLEQEFRSQLTILEQQYNELYAEENAVISIELVDDTADPFESAVGIVQREEGELTQGDDGPLVEHAQAPQTFRLRIDPATISSGDPLQVEYNPAGTAPAQRVTFTRASPTEVTITDSVGNTCSVNTTADIQGDIATGSLGGCTTLEPPLANRDATTVESIRLRNGDDVRGQYFLVTGDTSSGDKLTVNLNSDSDADVIQTFDRITVRIKYTVTEFSFTRYVELSPAVDVPPALR